MIRLARAAEADLRKIIQHSRATFGAAVADRTVAEIAAAFRRLNRFPDLGRPGRRTGTRELGMAGRPFIIIYRVTPAAIEIARIIHAAMQWPPVPRNLINDT